MNPSEIKLNICSYVCGDCAFTNKADYKIPTHIKGFERMANEARSFGCHSQNLPDDFQDRSKREELYNSGAVRLCRGFVEMMVKTGKSPQNNALLKKSMEFVKAQGLAAETMTLSETTEFHLASAFGKA